MVSAIKNSIGNLIYPPCQKQLVIADHLISFDSFDSFDSGAGGAGT